MRRRCAAETGSILYSSFPVHELNKILANLLIETQVTVTRQAILHIFTNQYVEGISLDKFYFQLMKSTVNPSFA